MNCADCEHFARDYSDDGYLPTGTCQFQFPPQFSFDNSVSEDDSCDLFKGAEPDKPPLEWERDGPNDTWTGKAPGVEYLCMRTWADVAVLYCNGVELRRSGSDGGHSINREHAEAHYNGG